MNDSKAYNVKHTDPKSCGFEWIIMDWQGKCEYGDLWEDMIANKVEGVEVTEL